MKAILARACGGGHPVSLASMSFTEWYQTHENTVEFGHLWSIHLEQALERHAGLLLARKEVDEEELIAVYASIAELVPSDIGGNGSSESLFYVRKTLGRTLEKVPIPEEHTERVFWALLNAQCESFSSHVEHTDLQIEMKYETTRHELGRELTTSIAITAYVSRRRMQGAYFCSGQEIPGLQIYSLDGTLLVDLPNGWIHPCYLAHAPGALVLLLLRMQALKTRKQDLCRESKEVRTPKLAIMQFGKHKWPRPWTYRCMIEAILHGPSSWQLAWEAIASHKVGAYLFLKSRNEIATGEAEEELAARATHLCMQRYCRLLKHSYGHWKELCG